MDHSKTRRRTDGAQSRCEVASGNCTASGLETVFLYLNGRRRRILACEGCRQAIFETEMQTLVRSLTYELAGLGGRCV